MTPHSEFETVIGLEIHAQVSTETKIFCGCPAKAPAGKSVSELGPNSHACPICAGHPGTLPVLNRMVVENAMKAGLATNCRINLNSVFARKNYFYPDLPKGYQISQFDKPICEEGFVEIETKNGLKRVNVQRIHMEEDAGKNLHMDEFSLVNLNRAGVPLIEIVSGPDMRSSEEASAYMKAVHAIVTAIGVCDGNMQEGNFRCDANVSVMPKGSKVYGTRAEIKNVNSFKFVEKAIEYEVSRQIALIQSGGKVVQETRLYDSAKNQTFSMRSKEEAHDYRYFPEPDLIPLKIEESWLNRLKETLPELPAQKKSRYMNLYGLSAYDAGVLTASGEMAQFFEAALASVGTADKSSAKSVANLVAGELSRLVNEAGIEISDSKVSPKHIADVVKLIQSNTVSSTGGKTAITKAWETGDSIESIVEREGLKQVSDSGALETAIDDVLAKNPNQVAEFKSGKDKLMGFFVGQAMKATGGKANPGMLQEILKKKLSS